ncbi:hypothetical protein DQ04_03361060 [Trypanosoma grayi]|uniref:hypothetical protein n=1 Tax=Trypanosoma grayi TaxID=71804 RepID=UPI0004F4ACB6|nr:hypothetical protein DQ04_03361060 [Trypanosoma grayi]KEG10734.1 hypothetical protein DQ04_03361060 [Trypanosoma grayi]
MTNSTGAVSLFWGSLLQGVGPAESAKCRSKRVKSRRLSRSIFSCATAVDTRTAKFWFCQNPKITPRVSKPVLRRQRTKKVHFSDEVRVVLIECANRSAT